MIEHLLEPNTRVRIKGFDLMVKKTTDGGHAQLIGWGKHIASVYIHGCGGYKTSELIAENDHGVLLQCGHCKLLVIINRDTGEPE